ncbi:MAG TPA: SEC-C metal-binding domain-containing protein, partial [Vineibacter sp.]|nr:SEC-C metal-binding domain-containing protein [Vineibacter sp.]
LKPKRGSFVWGGWEEAIVELGMVELKPLLQAAFNRGSIDITWSTFDESVKALDEAVANGCANIAGADRHFTPFGDVVDELSSWHAFSEKATEERAKRRQEDALALVAALPIPRRTADSLHDVPLKAPCPCGSGRKYKHCHGRVH